jgi:hypothetical protein
VSAGTKEIRIMVRATAAPLLVRLSAIVLVILTAFVPTSCGQGSAGSDVTAAGAVESSASIPLDKPAGTATGDLLLAQVAYSGGTEVTVAPPSDGWHQILRTDNGTSVGQVTYSKSISDAATEPASYVFVLRGGGQGGAAADACGHILRYANVDTADPVVVSSGNVGDSSRARTGSVATEEQKMLVALFAMAASDVTLTMSSDMSSMTVQMDGGQASGIGIYAADQSLGAGDSGDRTLVSDRSVAWTAQVIALRVATPKVTYRAGAHGALTPQHLGQTSESMAAGETPASVPSVHPVAGYAFAGWYRDYSAIRLTTDGVRGIRISADTTFTAQYRRLSYAVTFDLAGRGSSPDILIFSDVHYGDPITIPTVTATAGWTFSGWDKAPSTKVKGSVLYTALYGQAEYTVTFDLAGQGSSADTLVFGGLHCGDSIVVPTVDADPGCTFLGWDVTPSTTVTGGATYTAQYEQAEYTVTFDLAGKGWTEDTLVFEGVHFGDTITVPNVTPNPGWRFVGWDTTPSTTVTGDASYTALYVINRPK